MKGGAVIQIVLPAEVQQRKAVAEHQQPPVSCRHRIPEGLIQRGQLRQIVRQPGAVGVLVVGIGETQIIADDLTQRLCQHRRRPDMFIIGDLIPVVVVAVVIRVTVLVVGLAALHTLGQLLRQQGYPGHQRLGDLDVFTGGGQNIRYPLLTFAAVIEKHVGLGQSDDVQWCGFKAVGLPTGRNQQRDGHVIAADLPDEIVIGKCGAHHLQPSVVRRGTAAAAAQCRGQQQRQQQRRDAPPHSASSPRFAALQCSHSP